MHIHNPSISAELYDPQVIIENFKHCSYNVKSFISAVSKKPNESDSTSENGFQRMSSLFSTRFGDNFILPPNDHIACSFLMSTVMYELHHFYSELTMEGIHPKDWQMVFNDELSGRGYESKKDVTQLDENIRFEIASIMKNVFSTTDEVLSQLNIHTVSKNITLLILKCLAVSCYPFMPVHKVDRKIVQFSEFWNAKMEDQHVYQSHVISIPSIIVIDGVASRRRVARKVHCTFYFREFHSMN
jgi:hypothetical protein